MLAARSCLTAEGDSTLRPATRKLTLRSRGSSLGEMQSATPQKRSPFHGQRMVVPRQPISAGLASVGPARM